MKLSTEEVWMRRGDQKVNLALTDNLSEKCSRIRVIGHSTTGQASSKNLLLHEHGDAVGSKIALHVGGKYFAYCKGTNAEEDPGGCGSRTVEIAGGLDNIVGSFCMRVNVQDMEFALSRDRIVLAVIDVLGDVIVAEVMDDGRVEKLLDVCTVDGTPTHFRLVRFCPFIPDKDPHSEYLDMDHDYRMKMLLVVVNNATAEVWNLDKIRKVYQTGQTLKIYNITEGRVQTDCGSSPVVDASVSPDGTCFAVIDAAGKVTFFSLLEAISAQQRPKVKQVLPSAGSSEASNFSFLFFTDDLTADVAADNVFFWHSVIVGRNNVLEVYDTEKWEVVQTITISSPGHFKAVKSLTGNHLVLLNNEKPTSVVLKFATNLVTSALAVPTPQIYTYAAIQVKRKHQVRYFGFGPNSVDFCDVSRPSSAEGVVVRKALLSTSSDGEQSDATPKSPSELDKYNLDLKALRRLRMEQWESSPKNGFCNIKTEATTFSPIVGSSRPAADQTELYRTALDCLSGTEDSADEEVAQISRKVEQRMANAKPVLVVSEPAATVENQINPTSDSEHSSRILNEVKKAIKFEQSKMTSVLKKSIKRELNSWFSQHDRSRDKFASFRSALCDLETEIKAQSVDKNARSLVTEKVAQIFELADEIQALVVHYEE